MAMGAAALLVRWLLDVLSAVLTVAAAGAPVRPDEVLRGVAAAAAVVLLLWVALGVVLEVVAYLPGAVGDAARTASAAVTPRALRRSVGLVLGVGVAAGLAPGASVAATPVPRAVMATSSLPDPGFAPLSHPEGSSDPVPQGPTDAPAPSPPTSPSPTPEPVAPPSTSSAPPSSAATTPTHPPRADEVTTVATATPDPRWVAPAPTVRPQPDVRLLAPTPASPAVREVVVRRGDTLWSIAARHLGSDPSEAEIAHAWPAWHDANRHVIGDDPDLLLPGQVLRAPQSVAS